MLLLLGLVASGCMKAKASDASSYPGAPPADSVDMTASAPMDMDAAPTLSSDSAPREEREDRRSWKRSAKDEDSGGDAPMPKTEPAMPATTPGTDPSARTGVPAVEEPRKDVGGRLIIYTAAMRVSVFNLEEAMQKAEALPEKFGGYVFSMSAGAIVLKIPARKLREVMNELGQFGVVEERSLVSQDVSAEYTDVESRIKALEATHKQLLELLSKARTVDEALHVRQTLDQVGAELEMMKGRMRQLDSLISFSTLTVALYERGPFTPTPTSNDPFPWVDMLGVEATEWK
jgi:uncharacterized protein DUF4349